MEFKSKKEFFLSLLKLLPLSLLAGVLSGVLGALFLKCISFVTEFRNQNNWVLFFLVIGGLLTVLLYRLLKVEGVGTKNILNGFTKTKKIPILIIPAIFLSTLLTHLFGGSAGKEGAALQLGGGISALLSRIFKLKQPLSRVLILCSMAAFFSAVFLTPLGAFVFVLEIVFIGKLLWFSVLPSILASFSGYFLSLSLGSHSEKFNFTYSLQLADIWKIIIIAILSGLVAFLFCFCLHKGEHIARKYIKNPYLRISVGAVIVIALTLLIGTYDYNGGGMEYIENIFEHSRVAPEAFILKLLLTVITVSAGFKGGEIVPTFFIGAALGGAAAIYLGLPVPLGAAIGMASLFCGVTKCPLASLVIAFELFGLSTALIFIALAIIIAYFLSGKITLYEEKRVKAYGLYSKGQ